jgi:hypothetical protein
VLSPALKIAETIYSGFGMHLASTKFDRSLIAEALQERPYRCSEGISWRDMCGRGHPNCACFLVFDWDILEACANFVLRSVLKACQNRVRKSNDYRV